MKKKNKQVIFSLVEIEQVVKSYMIPLLGNYAIFTFQGPLGAGKTTFIKEFFRQCGVTEVVTSPTFTYVKQYMTFDGKMFNHFDLYRLSSVQSFLELGFDEYLYDENSWTVIEWPEILDELLQRSSISSRVWNFVLGFSAGDLDKRILQMASLR